MGLDICLFLLYKYREFVVFLTYLKKKEVEIYI
jgi:hypothetical protein